MGYFKRLGRLVTSNLNALLEKAEDPESVLDQLITEMEAAHKQAKTHVVDAMVDEKKIRRNLEVAEREAAAWKERAQVAVQKGDDEGARAALAQSKTRAQVAAEYARQATDQAAAVVKLKVAVEGLEKKVEEAKRRKSVILSKARTADLARALPTASGSLKLDTNAFDEFDRVAASVDDMEDRAAIAMEMGADAAALARAKLPEASPEDELDAELAALKAELGGGAAEEPEDAEAAPEEPPAEDEEKG